MDIRELLRHLRADPSNRSVARTLGIDRRTASQYRQWATEQGLLEGPLPSVEDLQALAASTFNTALPPQNVSTVEPYREQIVAWRRENVEIAAIHERLKERGFQHGYMAVYRFVKALEGPKTPEVVVRVETAPGIEAQVDFGDAGHQIDPRTGTLRRAYVFVMTLSYSRHQYAELVFDQSIDTWILLHRHAFEFFQGYMRNRQVLDRWLDNDHHLEYATFTQRKRGKAVVLAMVFSRFHIVEGTWLPEADGHSKASSLDTESCPTSLPRAAVA